MKRLDAAASLAAADPGGMLAQVADLPRQLERAVGLEGAVRAGVAGLRGPFRELLVCGMGGSAIGGDYAAAWAAPLGGCVRVHRGYQLPPGVDAATLLVFSSYSGDTEETLSAFEAAPSGTAQLCVTTGGTLGERARARGVPVLLLPGGLQPRAALGHSLGVLLWVLHAARLVCEPPAAALLATVRRLDAGRESFGPGAPQERNRAKQLALFLHGHMPWVVSGNGILAPVARRWKAQLHENAETMALASELPEMQHNEIMAPPRPEAVCRLTRLLFQSGADEPPALQRRLRLTAELFAPHVAGSEWIEAEGATSLERMLHATLLGDFTSVYLAILNGVDPTPVGRIQELKARLRAPR